MTKRYFKFTDGKITVFRGTGMVRGFSYGVLSHRGWISFANTPASLNQGLTYPATEITKAEFDQLVALKRARVIAAGRDNKYDSSPQDAWVDNAAIDGVANGTTKWLVENSLTDNKIAVVEAATAPEAIDAAYRTHGWKSFADARAKRATAAEEHEIVARRLDADGNEVGSFYGYDGAAR